jgi:hypothetical protein
VCIIVHGRFVLVRGQRALADVMRGNASCEIVWAWKTALTGAANTNGTPACTERTGLLH